MELEHKNRVEAILFTTGRFLGVDEISRLCQMSSPGYVKEILTALKEDYTIRGSALEVVNQGDKWRLNIKRDYLFLTASLLTDCELDEPTQKTLAIIAYKNPALQSEIIKIRGNGAYDQIKILKDLDFVVSEKSGRTAILKLTKKFYDYFDIVEDQLKSKLEEQNAKTE